MLAGEYLYARYSNANSTKILFGYNIPPWIWSAYEKVRLCFYFTRKDELTLSCVGIQTMILKTRYRSKENL